MRVLKRPRVIGGIEASFERRLPKLQRFWASTGEERDFGWKAQCYCGSTVKKRFRGSWWCKCGRESFYACKQANAVLDNPSTV